MIFVVFTEPFPIAGIINASDVLSVNFNPCAFKWLSWSTFETKFFASPKIKQKQWKQWNQWKQQWKKNEKLKNCKIIDENDKNQNIK